MSKICPCWLWNKKKSRAELDFSSPAGKMTVKHKQEAAGQSFRGVAGQPLQYRGSVTKHEGGEKDLAFCRLSGFFEQVTNLHEY